MAEKVSLKVGIFCQFWLTKAKFTVSLCLYQGGWSSCPGYLSLTFLTLLCSNVSCLTTPAGLWQSGSVGVGVCRWPRQCSGNTVRQAGTGRIFTSHFAHSHSQSTREEISTITTSTTNQIHGIWLISHSWEVWKLQPWNVDMNMFFSSGGNMYFTDEKSINYWYNW